MEPIFARLGVWHESRNFGNGGLGTSHHALAAGSLYGPDVNLLMWDSGTRDLFSRKLLMNITDNFFSIFSQYVPFPGMTEPGKEAHELFARQGIIGGIKGRDSPSCCAIVVLQ